MRAGAAQRRPGGAAAAAPEMMGRAPSFGMGKLESMELPDAVAAVVSCHRHLTILQLP